MSNNKLLKDLENSLNHGKRKWEEIEKEIADLQARVDEGIPIDNTQLAKVLILLSQHLAPLYSCNDQQYKEMNKVLSAANKFFK